MIPTDGKRKQKQKILIVDDSMLNRSILADILGDEYEVIEAENGLEAVSVLQKHVTELSLVLLDIVMPEMDGFGVLEVMNRRQWLDFVPVIMISAESRSSRINLAYEMGITDFISRPFDVQIVHHRVVNTILLYAKQKRLEALATEQMYEKEQRSSLMVNILSHIVETRNGESGMHVLHVRTLTELLLQRLMQKTDRYGLSASDISVISTASALHDIGKIAIDEKILNKPGRLTDEEFQIMKTHSMLGAKMLEDLPAYQNEPIVKTTYQICRWHHERFDGRGYPDGLQGDNIPISAQIVALADVYDALTSERVYKAAFSHDKALHMILNRECGVFNPLLLECLIDISAGLPEMINNNAYDDGNKQKMSNIASELQSHADLEVSERTLQMLEHERMKYNFFASLTQEIQFEYTVSPPMLTLFSWGAELLGMGELTRDPMNSTKILKTIGRENLENLSTALHNTTPNQPVVTYECTLNINDEARWMRIIARATWSGDEVPQYMGCIGKAIDIHDSHMELTALEKMASHDALTGLLNHACAKKEIRQRIADSRSGRFALVMFDLDHFKSANDTYGHAFGDLVLKYVAKELLRSIRNGDIAARVGGDEFIIFLEYKKDLEPIIQRIFNSLTGQYEQFTISLSMGVAQAEVVGDDYDDLFHAADQALYTVKRGGRGHFRFYDPSMQDMLSVISSIDSNQAEEGQEKERVEER